MWSFAANGLPHRRGKLRRSRNRDERLDPAVYWDHPTLLSVLPWLFEMLFRPENLSVVQNLYSPNFTLLKPLSQNWWS
jgi:hypothetical protein